MQEAEARCISSGRFAFSVRVPEACAVGNRAYRVRAAAVLKMHTGEIWTHA